MELKPTTADGQPVAGRSFIVPVKFDPGVLKGGTTITRPDWVRKPTVDELWNYVPAGLAMKGASVFLHCMVTTHGLLADCTATSDGATGENVRKAVVEMSKLFVMRPMTVDGQPVAGGAINIPIRFEGRPDDNNDLIRLIDDAPWLSAPTAAQMAAAYPKSALGIAAGHAVLRCRIKADGTLSLCDAVSEQPEDHGFAAAAKSLTQDFHVNVDPQLQALNRDGRVRLDLSFDFRNPNQASPPLGIQNPVWLKHFTAATVAEIYPAAAAKAGVKQGIGTVDCTVASDGTLADCVVAAEDPAGLGFGDAAVKAAAQLQMNPWTKQGAPVDGARIEVPIRLSEPQGAGAK
jgi:TonB family protein